MTESRVKTIFRALAVLLGVAQTIAARYSIGPDGRSYIEIARAYLRHDWPMAINAYWSPLYSWLLVATLGIVKPSWEWEYPTIHALNFLIFLAAMAAFEFFWKGMQKSESGVSHLTLWIFGYSLFIWLTVGNLSVTSPDLCLATIVYLIAGLMLRIRRDAKRKYFVWLGVALAAGYLTKAVLFPIAFVFLAVLLIAKAPAKKIALSTAIFVAIAAPQILLLSHAKHRFTFSDAGRLALAWSNWNVPVRDWQGEPASNGTPPHPTRQIHQYPAVFEFNGPIHASYPPWYDPSYWNEGLRFRFDTGVVLHHSLDNGKRILKLLLLPHAWALGMLVLVLLSSASSWKGIAAYWFLVVPVLMVFSIYALTYAEPRYFPPWEMMLWAGFLFGLRIHRESSRRVLPWLASGMAAIMLISSANGVRAQFAVWRHDDTRPQYAIVAGLQRLGVLRGQSVAAIGFDSDAHWAYLSGLSIVAEINTDQTCEFWSSTSAVQQEVLDKLKRAGASLVIAHVGGGMSSTSMEIPVDLASCTHPTPGWTEISPSRDLVYFLH
jgi:hypothetical protein